MAGNPNETVKGEGPSSTDGEIVEDTPTGGLPATYNVAHWTFLVVRVICPFLL
jgi:hypothetical protein